MTSISSPQIGCRKAGGFKLPLVRIGMAIVLGFAAVAGFAQTTTQYAINVTAPLGGVILPGSRISATTGQPVRYLWYGEAGATTGLCRIDPDIDTPGLHTLNTATCVTTLNGIGFAPGPAAFDSVTNNVYVTDIQKNSQGVFKLSYDPNGDGGNGLVAQNGLELAGIPSGKVTAVGCPVPNGAVTPNSLALGPDGNVYFSFKRGAGGAIQRYNNPSTPDNSNCANTLQTIATTPDGKVANGLAFLGHDLYGADGNGAFIIGNADLCLTPASPTCTATPTLALVGAPAAIASDQSYPSTSGSNIYFGAVNAVFKVTILGPGTQPVITPGFGGNLFRTLGALAVDARNSSNEVVYVGDDPSAVGTINAGRWFRVGQALAPPAAPAAPVNVRATAGDAQATVTWSAAQDGQIVSSFLVHASFTSDGSVVPDITINPDAAGNLASTTTFLGLTNGVSYQFEVQASNAQGSSPFSAPSNTVTPQARTAPGAPLNVAAAAGDTSALVSWAAPADGGSPITSYTVTTLIGGLPAGIVVSVPAPATSVVVNGLTNGSSYTFTVHATNAIGDGPESAFSNAVIPANGALPPDMAVTVAGPASADPNTQATYLITVTNNGPSFAGQVTVTNVFGGAGASLVSVTPATGSCQTVGTVTCSVGSLSAGASTTISVVLHLASAGVTDQASVQAQDADGFPFVDPIQGNNTASATTIVNLPPPPPTTTTDVQVTGSASNGGPAVNTPITYTWQVRNAQNQPANAVVFTDALPASFRFNSVTTTQGTCTGPAIGSLGGTVTCNLSVLASGQAMIVTLNVTPTQTGTIANTGSATFSGTDTNQANNQFTVTVKPK
jgi:uncharacterized repeat protein (TIGR01451 family)